MTEAQCFKVFVRFSQISSCFRPLDLVKKRTRFWINQTVKIGLKKPLILLNMTKITVLHFPSLYISYESWIEWRLSSIQATNIKHDCIKNLKQTIIASTASFEENHIEETNFAKLHLLLNNQNELNWLQTNNICIELSKLTSNNKDLQWTASKYFSWTKWTPLMGLLSL